MNERQIGFLVVCFGLFLFVGCASAPVIQDDVGEPLTGAVVSGAEIEATTSNIATLVGDLPESTIKTELTSETKRLNEQVAKLNNELDAAVTGYWKMIAERSREQTMMHEAELLAANRLTWAVAASALSAFLLLIVLKKFLPI